MSQSNVKVKEVLRELMLVRVSVVEDRQEDALGIVGQWSGRLLELEPTHFTAELSGHPERLNLFLAALKPYGDVKAMRSGVLAL